MSGLGTSCHCGAAAHRPPVSREDSARGANGSALAPIDLSAGAPVKLLYFKLQERKRDGRTKYFTVPTSIPGAECAWPRDTSVFELGRMPIPSDSAKYQKRVLIGARLSGYLELERWGHKP